MTALSLGRAFPSSFIGFDRLFDDIERLAAKQETSYPPYNIVRMDENVYLIELAVAGYRRHELDVQLENNLLTITGEIVDVDTKGIEFIHKGISSKKFKRTFTLNEHVKVVAADYSDGILTIRLDREIPESQKPRRIEIGNLGTRNDTLNTDTKQLLVED